MKYLWTNTKKRDVFLPQVDVKKRLKKIIISGVSRMHDPSEYYSNLANKIVEYYKEFNNTLLVEFYFDYINSGSTKWIYSLLQHMEFLSKEKGFIEVTWKYDKDDESIELTGDVLKSQSKIPFKMIPVEE